MFRAAAGIPVTFIKTSYWPSLKYQSHRHRLQQYLSYDDTAFTPMQYDLALCTTFSVPITAGSIMSLTASL